MNYFAIYAWLIWLPVAGFSQTPAADFKQYQPLSSSGPIPKNFLVFATEGYEQEAATISNDDKRFVRGLKDDFFRRSNYSLNKILLSGKVLYGDPITQYINQVADELLKDRPALRDKLEFYTYKCSSVNAMCTSKGVILINIGLLAHLSSEAELAYVLSHEISHYEQEHIINAFVEKHTILKGRGDYADRSLVDKMDLVYSFSKNHEYEADSLGLMRYLNSDYYVNAPLNIISELGYAHLPYDEVTFDQTLFNTDQLVVPSSYFRNKVSPISGIDVYADDYHTHPHIDKRRNRIERILMRNLSGEKKGKSFILPKESFNHISQLARFELVETDLAGKNYGNAIYNAFLLLQHFPDNQHLETSIAKALYGLAKYKNADRFHEVGTAYTKIDGESQQVHYLLKKLSSKQLNTLAIKYIDKTIKKHGTSPLLENLKRDLVRELVVTNEVRLADFYTHPQGAASDHDFHRLAFIDELSDEAFVASYKSYYRELEEKEQLERLTYREKQEREKQQQKEYERNGRKIFAKNVIAVDPDYWVDTRKGRDCLQSEEGELEMSSLLREASSGARLPLHMLDANEFVSGDTHTYNNLSRFKMLVREIYSHNELSFIPLFTDYTQSISKKYASDYVYYVRVYNNEATKQSYYNAILYNLTSGKIEYTSLVETGSVSLKTVKNNMYKDFLTIQQ